MRLVWHFVQSGQTRTSTRSREDLAALRAETIDAIDRIQSEGEFAPAKIPLCSWCEYKSICPAWLPEGETPTLRVSPARPAPAAAAEVEDQLQLL